MKRSRPVTAERILQSHLLVDTHGPRRSLASLERVEPALASFLMEQSAAIFGRLASAYGSSGRAKAVHRRIMLLTLTCVEALRGRPR